MSHQSWKEVPHNEIEITPTSISICFVHFRTLNLIHLDAAWFALSKQDMTGVNGIWFLDNNTEHSADELLTTLFRYQFCESSSIHMELNKHGDPARTHSWSVNEVCKYAPGPWILFCRTDYILAFDCLARLRDHAFEMVSQGIKPFVSGWCWQMAYDREARNIDANIDIEKYGWRDRGMSALLEHPYAFRFHETDQDAGVWFTNKSYLEEAGWMNEQLSSWGYQQSTFQRALRNKASVQCSAISEYLFAHQHHYADRDFDRASREYQLFGGGI